VWVAYFMLALLIAGFAYWAAWDSHDFYLYHFAARDMLEGSQDLYGPHFGVDWPMVYRYPPWFLMVLSPLALLPGKMAAGFWVLLKFVVLYFVVRMIRKMVSEDSLAHDQLDWYRLLPFLISAPYLVHEFKIGNAHFFVFAAMVGGLYFLHHRHPVRAAAFFALGIGIKLIPAFFLPYLLVKQHVRMVVYVSFFLLALLLLPAIYFGLDGNFELLQTWWVKNSLPVATTQEWGLGPDHSLRGVLTRYLSTVSYTSHRDPDYQNIDFAEFSPQLLQTIWLVVALLGYGTLLVWGARQRSVGRLRGAGDTKHSAAPVEYGLLFCAMLLLEPLTPGYYLVVLLFPALVLSYELRRLRIGFRRGQAICAIAVAATLLFAVPPLIPGRANQRWLTVYSPDFLGTLLLAICFYLLLRVQEQVPMQGGNRAIVVRE
jgi:hypothetical protein